MQYKRKQRVAGVIKERLSEIIHREIGGDLPCMVTIMNVDLSDDLKYAKIYFSCYGDEKTKKTAMNILKNKLKFLRRTLGSFLSMRNIPHLKFIEDDSLDNAFKISGILSKLNIEPEKDE